MILIYVANYTQKYFCAHISNDDTTARLCMVPSLFTFTGGMLRSKATLIFVNESSAAWWKQFLSTKSFYSLTQSSFSSPMWSSYQEILASAQSPIGFSLFAKVCLWVCLLLAKIFNFGKFVRFSVCVFMCLSVISLIQIVFFYISSLTLTQVWTAICPLIIEVVENVDHKLKMLEMLMTISLLCSTSITLKWLQLNHFLNINMKRKLI